MPAPHNTIRIGGEYNMRIGPIRYGPYREPDTGKIAVSSIIVSDTYDTRMLILGWHVDTGQVRTPL